MAPLSAAETLEAAVEALSEAGSYAFEATVEIEVQGDTIASEIEGWVDGADRMLVLRIDGEEVTTTVIDGVATVERDGESTEVPLKEAADAPSLEMLASLRSPEFAETTITGTLNSKDLKAVGFDVNGAATAIVTMTENGVLSGYEIVANNESWIVTTTFFDSGQAFSS